jgi:F0F1-type ATP synthase assembly protein I
MWRQLAIKALVSGLIIAAASEVARRSPAMGAFIAALPLTTLIALIWLWRADPDPQLAANFLTGTALYVAAALPAFAFMAWILRQYNRFRRSQSAGSPAHRAAG